MPTCIINECYTFKFVRIRYMNNGKLSPRFVKPKIFVWHFESGGT